MHSPWAEHDSAGCSIGGAVGGAAKATQRPDSNFRASGTGLPQPVLASVVPRAKQRPSSVQAMPVTAVSLSPVPVMGCSAQLDPSHRVARAE